jgi:hypothetical protein
LWEELKVDISMEPEQITDDYWANMIQRYVKISEPFHDTIYDKFAKEFVITVVNEVERINSKKWQENQKKS